MAFFGGESNPILVDERKNLTFLKLKSIKLENLYNYLTSHGSAEDFDEEHYQQAKQIILDTFDEIETFPVRFKSRNLPSLSFQLILLNGYQFRKISKKIQEPEIF